MSLDASPTSPANSSHGDSDGSEVASSVEEEQQKVPLADRLSELSRIEASIAELLSQAAMAFDALNPAVAPAANVNRKEVYALHADRFLEILETVSVRLRRSVRSLEEDEITIASIIAKTGFEEPRAFKDVVQKFTESQRSIEPSRPA